MSRVRKLCKNLHHPQRTIHKIQIAYISLTINEKRIGLTNKSLAWIKFIRSSECLNGYVETHPNLPPPPLLWSQSFSRVVPLHIAITEWTALETNNPDNQRPLAGAFIPPGVMKQSSLHILPALDHLIEKSELSSLHFQAVRTIFHFAPCFSNEASCFMVNIEWTPLPLVRNYPKPQRMRRRRHQRFVPVESAPRRSGHA